MRPAYSTGLKSASRSSAVRLAQSVGGTLVTAILSAVSSTAMSSTAIAASLPPATTQPIGASMPPMWSNHIEPIFKKSCSKCHGGERQKGGLDLRSLDSIYAGGTDGAVVIPGRPGESMLFQRLAPGANDHMPPAKEPQLGAEDVSLIQQWIATLATSSDKPSISAAASAFDQSAPSLLEMAAKVKWQPPGGVQPSDAIDSLIQAHWQEQHVPGNGLCDDRTFVRRIYLDLAGRIPTRAEADAFIASTETQKRAALVDQLLAGSEYPQHMAEVLDYSLMERKGKATEYNRKSNGWIEYLRSSVANGRSWKDMVADMIVARPKSPEEKGSVWFLYERNNNFQAMAEAVAPMAFGVSVACAQCHNHPMAHEIKQQHYWGLVSAFNRTANVDSDDGISISESATGGFVYFTNLKKESQPAILAFPNDRTIEEARPADGAKEKDSESNYIVPPAKGKGPPSIAAVPKFSRRQVLADAVTHDNPLLARAFVNRMWALYLGRGFVNPVDQMDSKHPPSHPELLTWLSNDFEQSGYDIKHLVRTIVLSHTYQLDSEWKDSNPPQPDLFARGLEKPLPAEVLYRSLLVATGNELPTEKKTAPTESLRQALIVAFPGMFDVEYNATLQQSMFFTNNPLFDALLKPAGQNLSARLLRLPTNKEKVQTAFAEILGRQPDSSEESGAVAFLDARNDRPDSGVRQFTWALLTSAEFLLNH